MRTSLILFGLLMMAIRVPAQPDTLPLPSWELVRKDKAGSLYVAASNGDVLRFTPGEVVAPLVYSPVRKTRISLLDVTNPLRPFLFYEDLQEYVILDRFLTETSRYSLAPYTAYAGIAAPALNNQLWLVDMVDFSLLKVDPQLEQVTIRIPLPQILDPDDSDFTFLREYQNMLFLADLRSGVYVFDNLGNFLRKIDERGLTNIHFRENMICFQKQAEPDTLYLEDIYSGQREAIPLPYNVKSALLGENEIWLFSEKELRILPQ